MTADFAILWAACEQIAIATFGVPALCGFVAAGRFFSHFENERRCQSQSVAAIWSSDDTSLDETDASALAFEKMGELAPLPRRAFALGDPIAALPLDLTAAANSVGGLSATGRRRGGKGARFSKGWR